MSAATFTIDRRPMAVTIPYGGQYPPTPGANIYGLDPAWITTPATRIAGLRTVANTYGIARRCLHLPQGTYNPAVAPFNNYPAGITLQAAVSAWLATFAPVAGESWELYTGGLMPMNPLGDLFVTGPTNAGASTAADADFLVTQAAPFLARGFVGHWTDALAQSATYVAGTLSTKLGAAGWQRAGTEALPVSGAPLEIIPADIVRTRFLMLLSYSTLFNPGRTWTVNPNTTEVHVWIDNGTATAADVQNFIDRGFIPGIVDGVTSAAASERIASWSQTRWKGFLNT